MSIQTQSHLKALCLLVLLGAATAADAQVQPDLAKRYFEEAKEVTGDYETVFREDHTALGNRIPFYSDRAVPHWREQINQLHEFDFSRLDYEIIGSIFERLISPEERHKYGQVDIKLGLILAVSSIAGVQVGIRIVESINESWGEAGSALYISLVFVVILTIIGTPIQRNPEGRGLTME